MLRRFRHDDGTLLKHVHVQLKRPCQCFAKEWAHFRRFAEARRLHAPDPVECARLFMGGLTFVRMQHIFWADKPASRDTLRAAMDRVTANFLALTLRGD